MSIVHNDSVGRRTYLKALGVGALSVGAFATPAAAHRGELQRELAAVRAATSKYADVQKAIEDGYVLESPFVPGMGYHYVNHHYVIENYDDEVDVTKPAALVYGTNEGKGREELILGAAEYLFDEESPTYTGPFPDLFHGDGDDSMWGYADGHWGLHAWVHVNNPNGTFFPFTPRPQFTLRE